MSLHNYRVDSNRQQLQWKFKWADDTNLPELTGHERAFELKAGVDDSFADNYSGSGSSSFDTNWPTSAQRYRDTLFMDSGEANFGVGTTTPDELYSGTTWSAWVRVETGPQTSTQYGFKVDFRVLSDVGGALCWIGPAYCTFPDYFHRMFNPGDYKSANNGTNHQHAYIHNWSNFGFESSSGWSFSSNANHQYRTTWGGYAPHQGSKFISIGKINPSGGQATLWTDFAYGADVNDNYTVEFLVRCRPQAGGTACSGEIGYKPAQSTSWENDSYFYIPDNGYWYICRVDFDHGGSNDWPWGATSNVRVYARHYTNLLWTDFDDVVFGGYANNVDDTQGDPQPPAAVGSTCTQASSYNS